MTNVFEEVRTRVSLTDAISYLGMVPTRREGDQLRFACPACKGDNKRALSVNPSKGFQCFASSKKGNDATALVAHCRSITQRDAAEALVDHFLTGSSPSSTKPDRKVEPGERGESSDALSPLTYLEPDHPIIGLLGLTVGTIVALGGGYAPKGTMIGRICIPLRLPDGTLVGYMAIATKPDQEPLLKFPPKLEDRCVPAKKPEPDEMRKLFRVVS